MHIISLAASIISTAFGSEQSAGVNMDSVVKVGPFTFKNGVSTNWSRMAGLLERTAAGNAAFPDSFFLEIADSPSAPSFLKPLEDYKRTMSLELAVAVEHCCRQLEKSCCRNLQQSIQESFLKNHGNAYDEAHDFLKTLTIPSWNEYQFILPQSIVSIVTPILYQRMVNCNGGKECLNERENLLRHFQCPNLHSARLPGPHPIPITFAKFVFELSAAMASSKEPSLFMQLDRGDLRYLAQNHRKFYTDAPKFIRAFRDFFAGVFARLQIPRDEYETVRHEKIVERMQHEHYVQYLGRYGKLVSALEAMRLALDYGEMVVSKPIHSAKDGRALQHFVDENETNIQALSDALLPDIFKDDVQLDTSNYLMNICLCSLLIVTAIIVAICFFCCCCCYCRGAMITETQYVE